MPYLRAGGELKWLSETSCSGMGGAELLSLPDAENEGLSLNVPLGPAAWLLQHMLKVPGDCHKSH